MSECAWIMALSIDEELYWAAVQIPRKYGVYVEGTLKEEFLGNLPDTKDPYDLHARILADLSRLKEHYTDIFDKIEAIGISSVGIIDVKNSRLMNIDRKNWAYHLDNDQKYIVDFDMIKIIVFGERKVGISVQNDAIAKCLAEYKEQYISEPETAVPNLALAMFHDGVNGGIVRGSHIAGKPLLEFAHHEIGHVLPRVHPSDRNFDPKNSACRVHDNCYVALSGGGRVSRQWAKPLKSLDCVIDGQHPWEVISHYIAQFCWGIFLTVPVDRILLSGSLIFPELVELVIPQFEKLNLYRGKRYIDHPTLDSGFIRQASLAIDDASVIGAFELARVKIVGLKAAMRLITGAAAPNSESPQRG